MPGGPRIFRIDTSLPPGRLDVFLRKMLPEISRAAIQRLLAGGHIRVDGRIVKPAHRARTGQTVSIEWPDARPAEALPEEMPLEILFEDEAILVLNKPAGSYTGRSLLSRMSGPLCPIIGPSVRS